MKILVFESEDIHQDALSILIKAGHEIVFENHYSDNPKDITAIFVRTYTKVDTIFLKRYKRLKYIIKAGAGLDNIDLEHCQKLDIHVFNSPGTNAHSVAELAVGFTIFLLRKISPQIESLKKNAWRQRNLLGSEVAYKTIGIIGCGAVGKLVAHKLKGFDVSTILGYDPYINKKELENTGIRKAELEEILGSSNVIILSIPLTSDTYNLIRLPQLQSMKTSSYIINVSRGGIINEKDLCYALNNDIIAGAALDVFEKEPNEILPELLSCKNLIATPHIGGFTIESDRNICVVTVENFLDFIR